MKEAIKEAMAGKKPGESIKKYKMRKVMHDWKAGNLHSGSKHGPLVTNPKQAIAIGLSEGRQYGGGK